MGSHLVEGQFQSDKYPTTPPGKVPLSVKDTTAQDLLWEYAKRRRMVDAEFSDDLETALLDAGFEPKGTTLRPSQETLTATILSYSASACPKCKTVFRNIEHPLRAGVVMQRLCECPVMAATLIPRCSHRLWMDSKEIVPRGPQCKAEATHTTCEPCGAVVCKAHRCRCSTPLSKALSDIAFVAAQQIHSAFSKFGPPHTDLCSEDCTEHNWGRTFRGPKLRECPHDVGGALEPCSVCRGTTTKGVLGSLLKEASPHKAWRIGDSIFEEGSAFVGRTIYEGDKRIGLLDHTQDAMTVVLAVNSWKADSEIRPTFEWAKEQSALAYARGLAESNVSASSLHSAEEKRDFVGEAMDLAHARGRAEGSEHAQEWAAALETLRREIEPLRKISRDAVAEQLSSYEEIEPLREINRNAVAEIESLREISRNAVAAEARMKGHLVRAMCGCTARDCSRHGAYVPDECDEALAIKDDDRKTHAASTLKKIRSGP